MFTFKTDTTDLAVKLPAQLDLRAAKPLKENLAQHLSKGHGMRLDASDVSRISTACVQVIAAFIIAAREGALEIKLTSASAQFTQAFDLLGLKSLLVGEAR